MFYWWFSDAGNLFTAAYFLIKRQRPEHYGWQPDGDTLQMLQSEKVKPSGSMLTEVEEPAFTLRLAMRTRAFWLLILAAAGFDLIGPALSVHGIPLLIDMGITPVKAAGMAAIVSFFSIISTFGIGFFADRVKKDHLRFLITGALLAISGGMGVFLLKQNMLTIYVFFVMYGLGSGVFNNILILARSHYFGRKNFGAIHGMSMLLTPPFGVVSPIFTGWVYDKWQGYLPAFAVFATIVALIALISTLARPPTLRVPKTG